MSEIIITEAMVATIDTIRNVSNIKKTAIEAKVALDSITVALTDVVTAYTEKLNKDLIGAFTPEMAKDIETILADPKLVAEQGLAYYAGEKERLETAILDCKNTITSKRDLEAVNGMSLEQQLEITKIFDAVVSATTEKVIP